MKISTPNYRVTTPTSNVAFITPTILTVKDESRVTYLLFKSDVTVKVEENGSTTNIDITGFTLIKP